METRFTFPPVRGFAPVWSPDGSRIAFSAGVDLYRKDASGGGQEQLLLRNGNRKFLSDWSRDGRFLLYTEVDPKTRGDLWILADPMGSPDAGKPVPFLQTAFMESQGQFSPDGRWIAYTSDESGAFEVYVRPFPAGAGKWRISTNGGREPRWRRDGKELFYLETQPVGRHRRLIAVPVQPGPRPALETGVPKALFEFRSQSIIPDTNGFGFAAAADGQRFLVSTLVDTATPTLNVIVNWQKAVSAGN